MSRFAALSRRERLSARQRGGAAADRNARPGKLLLLKVTSGLRCSPEEALPSANQKVGSGLERLVLPATRRGHGGGGSWRGRARRRGGAAKDYNVY